MKHIHFFILFVFSACNINHQAEEQKEAVTETSVTTAEQQDNSVSKYPFFSGYEHIETKSEDFLEWYIPFMDTLKISTGYAPDKDNGMYIINKDAYFEGLKASGYVSERLISQIKKIYDHCETIDEGEDIERLGCLDGEPFVYDFAKKRDLKIKYENLDHKGADINVKFVMSYYKSRFSTTKENELTYTFRKIDGQWLIDSTSTYGMLERYYGVNN